jgi:hypothetical protein
MKAPILLALAGLWVTTADVAEEVVTRSPRPLRRRRNSGRCRASSGESSGDNMNENCVVLRRRAKNIVRHVLSVPQQATSRTVCA